MSNSRRRPFSTFALEFNSTMKARAISGFRVKVDTVETRLVVFSVKTWFRLNVYVVCHRLVCHANPWSAITWPGLSVCSVMRVTRIAGFFFCGGEASVHKFWHHFVVTSPISGEYLNVFRKTVQQFIPEVGVCIIQRKFYVTEKLSGS
jgi:hypothetical protein